MTIGSPGIFQRPTRTFNPSFFKACSRHAAQRFSFSLNKDFPFLPKNSGPMKKTLSLKCFLAVFWPWWTTPYKFPYFITYLPTCFEYIIRG